MREVARLSRAAASAWQPSPEYRAKAGVPNLRELEPSQGLAGGREPPASVRLSGPSRRSCHCTTTRRGGSRGVRGCAFSQSKLSQAGRAASSSAAVLKRRTTAGWDIHEDGEYAAVPGA